MADQDKLQRSRMKAVVTRHANSLNRFIAEESKLQVQEFVIKLKDAFNNFEHSHLKYHDALSIEQDDLIEESDKYFFEVQNMYIQALNSAKDFLRNSDVLEDSKSLVTKSSDDKGENVSQSDLIRIMNLPKVKLEVFDGDPLKYHSFFALFDENVDSLSVDNKSKLTRLIQYTSGKALESIRSCMLIDGDEGYANARKTLLERFGNHHLISDTVIKSLKNGKPIRSSFELQQFSDEIRNHYATLVNMKKIHEIDTQSSIIDVVYRLQPYLQNRWKREAMEFKRENNSYPDFERLVEFISRESEAANDPVYGQLSGTTRTNKSPCQSSSSVSSFSTEVSTTRPFVRQCIICREDHKVLYCPRFRSMKVHERWELVKTHKLCENCLMSNHNVSDCRKPHICTVPGCGLKHTNFLHVQHNLQSANDRNSDAVALTPNSSDVNQVVINNSASNSSNTNLRLPVIKVLVEGKVESNALLDSASTSTFCTRKLVDSAHLNGTLSNYTLSTISQCDESKAALVVDLYVRASGGRDVVHLSNVYVVDRIPACVPNVDKSKFPHLKDLPIPDVSSDVDILVGQDHCEVLIPMETRQGRKGQPYAMRTLLGWSICGPVKSDHNRNVVYSHVTSVACDSKFDRSLRKQPVLEIVKTSDCHNTETPDDKVIVGNNQASVGCEKIAQSMLSDVILSECLDVYCDHVNCQTLGQRPSGNFKIADHVKVDLSHSYKPP
jgi:hypothetical protein